jgi:dsRNA-specific ribonuclease
LGLGLETRIQVGSGCKVSQSILEDVVEAIAGAIDEELGFSELYAWTEVTFGPMIEIYKVNMIGKLLCDLPLSCD